jgi:hypothetical protein
LARAVSHFFSANESLSASLGIDMTERRDETMRGQSV